MTSFASRWNRIWFAGAPLGDLAVCRILWAGTQMLYLLLGSPGERIAGFEGPSAPVYEPIPMLRLLALPFGGADALDRIDLERVYAITLVAGCLCVVGLYTRASLLVFALGNLLLQAWIYSTDALTHHIALLQWALLLLAFSPCGAVWSVDAWIARRSKKPTAQPFEHRSDASWPLRVVHVLVALAYFSAATTKVMLGHEEWFGGWTLHYYVSFLVLRRDSLLGGWLAQHHEWIVVLSWLVCAFEGGFLLSLFHKRWVWAWAIAAVLVHAGALVFMGILFPVFPLLCAAFVPWCDVLRWLQGRARVSESLRVGSSV